MGDSHGEPEAVAAPGEDVGEQGYETVRGVQLAFGGLHVAIQLKDRPRGLAIAPQTEPFVVSEDEVPQGRYLVHSA